MASPAGSTGKEGSLLSTQHQTEKCDGPTAATKHVTFGPSLQPTPSSADEGAMVPFSEAMSHFTSSSNPLASIPLDSPLPKEFDAVVTAVLFHVLNLVLLLLVTRLSKLSPGCRHLENRDPFFFLLPSI